MWYCDIYEKEVDINTKSKLNISKIHIHRKEYSIVVKKYETIKPENGETTYTLKNFIKNCSENFFHTFENR